MCVCIYISTRLSITYLNLTTRDVLIFYRYVTVTYEIYKMSSDKQQRIHSKKVVLQLSVDVLITKGAVSSGRRRTIKEII